MTLQAVHVGTTSISLCHSTTDWVGTWFADVLDLLTALSLLQCMFTSSPLFILLTRFTIMPWLVASGAVMKVAFLADKDVICLLLTRLVHLTRIALDIQTPAPVRCLFRDTTTLELDESGIISHAHHKKAHSPAQCTLQELSVSLSILDILTMHRFHAFWACQLANEGSVLQHMCVVALGARFAHVDQVIASWCC